MFYKKLQPDTQDGKQSGGELRSAKAALKTIPGETTFWQSLIKNLGNSATITDSKTVDQ